MTTKCDISFKIMFCCYDRTRQMLKQGDSSKHLCLYHTAHTVSTVRWP